MFIYVIYAFLDHFPETACQDLCGRGTAPKSPKGFSPETSYLVRGWDWFLLAKGQGVAEYSTLPSGKLT